MAVIEQLKLLGSRKAADRPSTAAPTAPAADEDDLPIPSDINAVFLGGLFLLAMLAACYVAAEIVLPIVLAFVLSLVAFGTRVSESMENEKSDDQNRNGNTERPEKSVFHQIYSGNHLFGLYYRLEIGSK